MVRMQDSTDTLVDEGSLVNKKLIINSANNNVSNRASNENVNVIEDVFEMSIKGLLPESKLDSENQTDLLGSAINNLAISTVVNKRQNTIDSSSTPLSSSIPSPETSMFSIHKNFPNKKPNQTTTINPSINNTVSTSTSGLSDYVHSTKFRYINDSIKSFEKHFNEQNENSIEYSQKQQDSMNPVKQRNGHINHGDHADLVNSIVTSNGTRHHSNSNGHSINNVENRMSRLKSNDKMNSVHTTSICNNKRIASKSIPIVKKKVETSIVKH